MDNNNKHKNINDQNFAHFMRGYDKGFYGSTLQKLSFKNCSLQNLPSVDNWLPTQNFYFINEY